MAAQRRTRSAPKARKAKAAAGGARALWKGVLAADSVRVPVKLYSAVQDRTVHFRLLHRRDLTPVVQQLVDPKTGDPVPTEAVRKGLEVEPGVFVLLRDEELERLEPEASRDIEVVRVVDAARVDHRWYERPYWVGPDEGAADDWRALVTALGARVALVRWVMRKKPYVGALRAEEGRLVLFVLRHADEVVSEAELDAPPGRDPSPQELRLAEQLVSALAADFDPTRYRDEYRARVAELIEAKAKGAKPRRRRPEERPETTSLAKALQASLRAGEGKRAHG